MDKYLLLRDNKQSGPYTVAELIAKGLKPYDLVWLEGKGAAWRYPSELSDFNGFAPAVEEQPYDRFYKKKPEHQVNQTHSAIVHIQPKRDAGTATGATTVEATVITSTPVEKAGYKSISSKKIYVTLPAQSRTATTAGTANEDAATLQKAADALALNEKFARLREEKIKQAESVAANPIVTVKGEQPRAFSELVEPALTASSASLPAVHTSGSNRNRILLGCMAAACLVLAGIIIGLVISNSRQQQDNAAIEKLVQQIQERDKNKQVTSLPAQPAATLQESENLPSDQHLSASSLQDASHEQVSGNPPGIAAPAARKEPVSPKKENNAGSGIIPSQTVQVIPAVVTNKQEGKTVKPEETESARRNIHQLVDVEANKYKTGVLGGISDLRLTLSNNSLYPLDQVEVEVRYLGPEKKLVKTQTLLFNDVAAGEQKTVEAPRTNRGVTVEYAITRINSKALGLAHAGY